MLCHGDIVLLSGSSKNIIRCQKKKKSFLCDTKKFFVHHKFFIFNFYIAHWQHVDLLRSGPRNKEAFNPSFTHLSDIPRQLLRAALEKKVFLVSRVNVCTTSVKGSYFSRVAGFFPATFAKINTVTGIFQ